MAQATVTKTTTVTTRNVPARRGAPPPKPKPLGPGNPTVAKKAAAKQAKPAPPAPKVGVELFEELAEEVAYEMQDSLPEGAGVLIIITDGENHAASACGWPEGKEAELLRSFADTIESRTMPVGKAKTVRDIEDPG